MNLKMTIGDSVTEYPALAAVYMAYGVDYCCGGERSIDEAVKDAGADSGAVLLALEEKIKDLIGHGESENQLSSLDNEQLINHIVNKHHAFLRRVLPELASYLFKLIDVHGQRHPELLKIHQMIGQLRIELEQHLVKEEKLLFPLITGNKWSEIPILINELEREHDGTGDILKNLTVMTEHFTLPVDACNTYAVTYSLLQQLQVDMYEHVHKENSILFKRVIREAVL